MSSAVMTNTEAGASSRRSGFFDTEVTWIFASSSIDRSAKSAVWRIGGLGVGRPARRRSARPDARSLGRLMEQLYIRLLDGEMARVYVNTCCLQFYIHTRCCCARLAIHASFRKETFSGERPVPLSCYSLVLISTKIPYAALLPSRDHPALADRPPHHRHLHPRPGDDRHSRPDTDQAALFFLAQMGGRDGAGAGHAAPAVAPAPHVRRRIPATCPPGKAASRMACTACCTC